MTPEQFLAAKGRAADVVNGFKLVTEQIARDALKLAAECEAKDRTISALKKRMLEDEQMRQEDTPLSALFKAMGI